MDQYCAYVNILFLVNIQYGISKHVAAYLCSTYTTFYMPKLTSHSPVHCIAAVVLEVISTLRLKQQENKKNK